MKSACIGVLSIIELKNARWNIEINESYFLFYIQKQMLSVATVWGRTYIELTT